MASLPQLIEEDIRQLDRILQELLANSEAATALIIDKGGFLITYTGESERRIRPHHHRRPRVGLLSRQPDHRQPRRMRRISTVSISRARNTAMLRRQRGRILPAFVLIFPRFRQRRRRQIFCRPFRHRHRPPARTRERTRPRRRPRPFRPQSRGHTADVFVSSKKSRRLATDRIRQLSLGARSTAPATCPGLGFSPPRESSGILQSKVLVIRSQRKTSSLLTPARRTVRPKILFQKKHLRSHITTHIFVVKWLHDEFKTRCFSSRGRPGTRRAILLLVSVAIP